MTHGDEGERRATVRATVLVVLSACCFGSVSPLTVVALRGGASLQGVQTWRYATTALALMGWARWRGTRQMAAPASKWWSPKLLAIAGGGQALVATLALMSLNWIPAATVAFVFYTFPAWVAAMAAVRGLDRPDRVRVTALVLSLGGIAVMVGAPSGRALSPIGVSMALSAAVAYAIYIPVLDGLQRSRPALDVSRAIAVGGGLVFALWALMTGTLVAHFTVLTFAVSALQGLLSAGAFLGFMAGLSHMGPVRTSITSTVEPFWTALLGVLLLGQTLGAGTLVGGLAIMAAVLLLNRPAVSSPLLHSSSTRKDDRSGRPTS